MSKLGTHDGKPVTRKAPLYSAYGATPHGPVCVVCGAPATERCERCHVGLCFDHATRVDHMFWDGTWVYAPSWLTSSVVMTHRHYRFAGEWRVCGSCRRIVAAHNAREIAKDRANARQERIQSVVMLAILIAIAIFIVVWDILTVTRHLHGPPIPTRTLP